VLSDPAPDLPYEAPRIRCIFCDSTGRAQTAGPEKVKPLCGVCDGTGWLVAPPESLPPT